MARASAPVSTKTSCSRPRSRADGVRIVFGPMKIFLLCVIAWRTSFSLTNGEISTLGFTGFCVGGAAGGFGALVSGAADLLASESAAAAAPDKPEPRAMPCAESTCSTKRARTARSGSPGDGGSDFGALENSGALAGEDGDGDAAVADDGFA